MNQNTKSMFLIGLSIVAVILFNEYNDGNRTTSSIPNRTISSAPVQKEFSLPTITPSKTISVPDFVLPGAREKYSLDEIVSLLDAPEKLHLFMKNNMRYIPEEQNEYCHPSVIYKRGGDDCDGLAIFARYVLEQNGYEAWHMGVDNHAAWGHNVAPFRDRDGKLYYLDNFAEKKGPYNSFQDMATSIIPNWTKISLYGTQAEGCKFPETVQEIIR